MTEARFERARTIDHALDLLASQAAGTRPVLLAGGTDWMVEHHLGLAPASANGERLFVDVSCADGLRDIVRESRDDGAWYTIGGAATYLAMRRHPTLVAEIPMIDAMAREVGAI